MIPINSIVMVVPSRCIAPIEYGLLGIVERHVDGFNDVKVGADPDIGVNETMFYLDEELEILE